MALCACYVSTPYIFPVVLSGTAFGICNLFARCIVISAPFVTEMEIPFPMEVFSCVAIVGILGSLFVSVSKEDADANETRTTEKTLED